MNDYYKKEYSWIMDREMEHAVFGDSGVLCVAFGPQNGHTYDFRNFGMIDTIAPWIDAGKLRVLCVDSIDEESWSDTWGDKEHRAQRQEDYFRYVTDELIPLVHEINGTDRRPLAIGCSLGATHAAIAAFRRPDLFQGCIALSGVYDTKYFWGDWMNDVLYGNCITAFLPNMPADHPYVDIYARRQLVLCVGQGAWEDQGIADLRIIRDNCRAKGIPVWCDFWGDDVNHDWPWWRKQIRYFLPYVLEDMDKTLAAEE